MPAHLQLERAPATVGNDASPPRVDALALLRAGALEMHYQPILDLPSNTIRKVEALARLRDGDRLLLPGEFLPRLDSEGLHELFVLGLDAALRDRNCWLLHGVSLDISLNLPPSALADGRYVEATRCALERHGCPASVLTLEVLESGDIGDATHAAAQFQRFSALGVNMAEDDLGAGYSSLVRLRELDFQWIKIDRSIVQLTGRDDAEVLQFVYLLTRLGHSLGKLVIVEGVEDASLVAATRVLGVDAVQGYGVGRPMPASAILECLAGRPLAPSEPVAPSSALERLAKLLLVEERLQACQGVDLGQRERFLADLAAIYPEGSVQALATQHLIDTAIQHGVSSAAYRQERRRLTDTA